MGGGKRGLSVVENAQHAQGASTGVHGVHVWGKCPILISTLSLCYPVDDEAEDEDEDDDDDDEEDEVGAVERLLRRCWLRGMPRCADR
jgi:hypothetical protein